MSSGAECLLGIDLGTSFSTAASFVGGKLHFALDGRGEACIPSVVHFPKTGAPIVGIEADRLRAEDPPYTLAGIKRLLGCRAGSPSVRLHEASSAVRLSKHCDGSLRVVGRRGEYALAEVAAMIFSHLRERTDLRFGTRAKKVVLTMPVTAGEAAKRDTLLAAKIAQLEVIRVVYEPCAAAVSLGLDQFRGERRLLIYDLGGGTFDVTIVVQRDDHFEVLASGGDECLGGDDFDQALAKHLANRLWHQEKVDVTKDLIRWDQMHRLVERAKRALSKVESTHFNMDDAFSLHGRSRPFAAVIHRREAEECWVELVERSIRITAQTLLAARLRPKDLAGVVLIGGTTAIPMVLGRVERLLERRCVRAEDPQTSVAVGAARIAANQAELLGDSSSSSECRSQIGAP